jgi:hypothetical protein
MAAMDLGGIHRPTVMLVVIVVLVLLFLHWAAHHRKG